MAAKKNSLVANINRRKKAGKSRPKKRSTIAKTSYDAMEEGWPKSKKKDEAGARKNKAGAKKRTTGKAGAKKQTTGKAGGEKQTTGKADTKKRATGRKAAAR